MDKKALFEVAPKQLDRVLSFFSRVDAKASFVFAMNSALLGVVAVHVQRPDFFRLATALPLALFACGLAASYFYVFRSSFPYLAGGQASLIYFKEIANQREQQFLKSFRGLTEDAYVDDVLSQVWRNSQILTKKFHAIKIAFILTGLCLLPWTAFLVQASSPVGTP